MKKFLIVTAVSLGFLNPIFAINELVIFAVDVIDKPLDISTETNESKAQEDDCKSVLNSLEKLNNRNFNYTKEISKWVYSVGDNIYRWAIACERGCQDSRGVMKESAGNMYTSAKIINDFNHTFQERSEIIIEKLKKCMGVEK